MTAPAAADLHRFVYYSRNRLRVPPQAMQAEIAAILAASRRNNMQGQVTGALMFNAGCFAQVLEGPLAAVEATFERIQRDERHGEVNLLALQPIARRAFPDWSMGFVGQSLSDRDALGFTARESGFDPERMSGDHLFETLHRLALEEEAVAS